MEWFLILPLYLCSIVLLGCMAVLLIMIVIQVFRIFRGSEAVKQLSKKSLLRSTLFSSSYSPHTVSVCWLIRLFI